MIDEAYRIYAVIQERTLRCPMCNGGPHNLVLRNRVGTNVAILHCKQCRGYGKYLIAEDTWGLTMSSSGGIIKKEDAK